MSESNNRQRSDDDSVRNAGCLETLTRRGDGGQEPDWWQLGEVMRVILDVVQGPLKGRQFVLDRHDTFIVGRSRFVHCPMPEDMALSRDHFMIEINPPQCELRDLGSTNGTFVNNHRVDRVRLASGDLIAAGQSVFRVAVESAEMIVVGGGTADADAAPTASLAGGRRSAAPAAAPAPRRT